MGAAVPGTKPLATERLGLGAPLTEEGSRDTVTAENTLPWNSFAEPVTSPVVVVG